MYSDDFNWRCNFLLGYSNGWLIIAISYKDIATPYELLPHLDIVAIYAITTEIFHCTSAWLHLTYVVAKSTIATLSLVSATTKVVASTTHCHAERRCNKPALSQQNTIRWDRLLPLTYMWCPDSFPNDPKFVAFPWHCNENGLIATILGCCLMCIF